MRHCVAAVLAILALLRPAFAVGGEPSAEDLASIDAMHEQGIDLQQPQVIEFLVSFPRLQDARKAGKQLTKDGFTGKIEAKRGGRDALLFARKRVTVDAETLGSMRERFEAIAEAGGGRYEGWGLP